MAIAVLTSGGDSPGMNACYRAVVRKALNNGYEIFGIYEGFRGMYDNNIKLLNRKDVAEIINRGGTKLRSARFPEFPNEDVLSRCIDNLKLHNIDTVLVIGGNGSYEGGILLSKHGINTINIPGTIDNDILGTDYTIGFDTAVNTAVEAIDKLRDTSSSHNRASIVEVMGRHNGDIAFSAGLASGAEAVFTIETGYDEDEFISQLSLAKNKRKSHAIIVVGENFLDINELGNTIENHTGFIVNKIVLGHIQRGGVPSSFDRKIATMMGYYAVEMYAENKLNRCVILKNNCISDMTYDEYKSLTNEEDLKNKKKMSRIINEVG